MCVYVCLSPWILEGKQTGSILITRREADGHSIRRKILLSTGAIIAVSCTFTGRLILPYSFANIVDMESRCCEVSGSEFSWWKIVRYFTQYVTTMNFSRERRGKFEGWRRHSAVHSRAAILIYLLRHFHCCFEGPTTNSVVIIGSSSPVLGIHGYSPYPLAEITPSCRSSAPRFPFCFRLPNFLLSKLLLIGYDVHSL